MRRAEPAFCGFCRCWTANCPLSISQHPRGSRFRLPHATLAFVQCMQCLLGSISEAGARLKAGLMRRVVSAGEKSLTSLLLRQVLFTNNPKFLLMAWPCLVVPAVLHQSRRTTAALVALGNCALSNWVLSNRVQ